MQALSAFLWAVARRPMPLLFVFCLLHSRSAAAEQEGPLTFAEMRAYAFSHSRLVASIDAAYSQRLAEALEAGLLQNPELEAEALYPAAHTGQRGDNEFAVALSQPLRPGDFGTRQTVRRLMQQAASQQQRLDLLELSQNLYLKYIQLWALKERRRFVTSMRQTAKKKARQVSEARAKGFFQTSEVKLFEGAAAKLDTVLLGVEADIAAAEAEITSSTGLRLEGRKLLRPPLAVLPSLQQALQRSADSPLGLRGRQALLQKLADRQSRLARINSYPAITPALLYEHSDDKTDFVGLGLSIELPIFDRGQPELLSSSARRRELGAQRSYLSGEDFELELAARLRSAGALQTRAELYQTKVFPIFEQALAAAERQLEAGQSSVLQLWQAFEAVDAANEALLELWTKAYAAQSEISLILGDEL